MKLLIQIPCLNEREHLPGTFADLPRRLPGIDCIEVLVVDDGSTDGTSEVARELGVHHIVRFHRNRGLAAAYLAGLDAAVRLGADVVVNTDADNQYRGEDIAELVAPVVRGSADLVVGDRQTDTILHFSPLKRLLQRWGSSVVRAASGTDVADATSGFRAVNRRTALQLFVHNRFSYTLETLIQAGRAGLVIASVPIRTNPKTRESRLFKGIPDYLRRNGPVIVQSYVMYRPVQTFAYAAGLSLLVGTASVLRFLYYFVREPDRSGHVQSLTLGVGAVVLGVLLGVVAMISDLLAANRRLLEATLRRVRQLDAELARQRAPGTLEGVESTGAEPWRAD